MTLEREMGHWKVFKDDDDDDYRHREGNLSARKTVQRRIRSTRLSMYGDVCVRLPCNDASVKKRREDAHRTRLPSFRPSFLHLGVHSLIDVCMLSVERSPPYVALSVAIKFKISIFLFVSLFSCD